MKRKEYEKLETLAKALVEYAEETEEERTSEVTDLERGGMKTMILKIDLDGFTRWLADKINSSR